MNFLKKFFNSLGSKNTLAPKLKEETKEHGIEPVYINCNRETLETDFSTLDVVENIRETDDNGVTTLKTSWKMPSGEILNLNFTGKDFYIDVLSYLFRTDTLFFILVEEFRADPKKYKDLKEEDFVEFKDRDGVSWFMGTRDAQIEGNFLDWIINNPQEYILRNY